MQTTLDLSIKIQEAGTIDGGYVTYKSYPSYMSNQEWESFINDMEQNHNDAYLEYGAGSGGELKPKGKFPPKMASYGSSSRMIYNLCKDIPGFHFEYQLPTKVGGIANLDGFFESTDRYIFVEAKCREPYAIKSHLIERKYKDLYNYITNDKHCNLNIVTKDCESKMKVDFSAGECPISCFDIKQMICHLLGVAAKFLKDPSDKKITFVYLCYNPTMLKIADEKKKEQIFMTYEKMCYECKCIDFTKLFETIVKYLCLEFNLGNANSPENIRMLSNFEFVLCDQSNYANVINYNA